MPSVLSGQDTQTVITFISCKKFYRGLNQSVKMYDGSDGRCHSVGTHVNHAHDEFLLPLYLIEPLDRTVVVLPSWNTFLPSSPIPIDTTSGLTCTPR